MKTKKFLIMMAVGLMTCSTAVYAQSNNKSVSTVTKKMLNKSSSNKEKISSSSNTRSTQNGKSRRTQATPDNNKKNTSNTYQSTGNSRGVSGGHSTSRGESSSTNRREMSSPNTSRNNTGGGNRAVSPSPARNTQTGSVRGGADVSNTRENTYRGNVTSARVQGGSSNRGTANYQRQQVSTNISHSRERMVQRRKSVMTKRASTLVPTGSSKGATSATSAVAHQAKSSNFIYSPYSNSVKRMRPLSTNSHSNPRQITYSGLWNQCKNNSKMSQAQTYAKQNLNMNVIDYGISGRFLFVISEDNMGVYLQACNEEGKVLDEQKISREYVSLVTNEENSGCWITKKNEIDPLYYSFDGEHLLRMDPDEGMDIIDLDFCDMVTYTISRENQRTFFQVYSDTEEEPLASTEINDDFCIIDVEDEECTCYIKDSENKRSVQVFFFGEDGIEMVDGE